MGKKIMKYGDTRVHKDSSNIQLAICDETMNLLRILMKCLHMGI